MCPPKFFLKSSHSSLRLINVRYEWTGSDTHLACSTSARTPAASGAEAEVPVCFVVHVAFRSVVVYKNRNHHLNV